MKTDEFDDYSFDIGPMGAIGEHTSLMLRINRNCPWNRCLFCTSYKGKKFEYRSPQEVKRDIDVVRKLADKIETSYQKLGYQLGYDGTVNEIMWATFQNNPEIYGAGSAPPQTLSSRRASLHNVANWLWYGGKTIFLQDANALIMRTPELVEVLKYLRESFPTINRITSFGRAKTCAKKSLEELKELKEAGLSKLLVGLESGCNEVLKEMEKGVTAEEHVIGGKKVVEAGIYLASFVMPGLGGRRWSEKHIPDTARALNEIEPNLIKIRSLAILRDSLLYGKWKYGDFEQLSEDEMVNEIKILIENLNCNSYLISDQMTNVLIELEGQLPAEKEKMLGQIATYQTMTPMERLQFRLNRYLNDGYLDYIEAVGKLDSQLVQLIKKASESLNKESPDAQAKVDQAILAIKEKGVP